MTLTQVTKAGLHDIALDHVFTIGASGTDHYTFQGEGLNGTVNDPTLYLTRGKTYRFENGSGGHPIRIQSTSGASGTAYNTGVTNNAGSGTVIVEVQHNAPDVLYYQCTSHANMNGILYITGALADGGVTTAKIADNAVTTNQIASGTIGAGDMADLAVTTAKLNDAAVTTTKIADSQIITAKINNSAVTTAKIAADAVTEAKIANDAVRMEHILANNVTSSEIASSAVTTAKIAANAVTSNELAGDAVATGNIADNAVSSNKIANEAVTLAKLPHGTSSNDGKFLRANNGADPTFESLPSSGLSNIVEDTSPQLGGDLDGNGNDIKLGDSSVLRLGSATFGDLKISHNGSTGILDNVTGDLNIKTTGSGDDIILLSNDDIELQVAGGEAGIKVIGDGGVELYHNQLKKFETTSDGYYYYGTTTGGTGARSNAGITQNNVLTPAARFFTGGYQNADQNVTIQATTGNWVNGSSSSTHRSCGLLFSRTQNNVQQKRAGIQHDINSTEKFKFWTSYGDIHFRTRNGNNGDQTWEECDKDPLILHHNGHVAMMHMPRILLSPGGDNASYSNDLTLHDVTGSAVTHGGMTYSSGTITVPYQGVYQINANVGLHTNSNNTQRINMLINGSNFQNTEQGNSSGWHTHHINHVIELAANNTIKFQVAGRWDSSVYSRISVCMMHGTLTT